MLNQFQLFYHFVILTKEESQQTGATNEIDSPVRYCWSPPLLGWLVNNSLQTLRHSPGLPEGRFTTHLLENGTDLRYIQICRDTVAAKLLKPMYEVHEHLKKQEKVSYIYTHVSTKSLQQIKSPFDDL